MNTEIQERFELRNARYLAADYMRRSLLPGDIAIDATMGNGKDTQFLCELVGDMGRVYAFDVQPEALQRTDERLTLAGFRSRAELILAGHETMETQVQGTPQAIMFNLGWLPGTPHAVTTKTHTTLLAVQAACRMIAHGGIITLCIYPGHEEGRRELDALTELASALPVQHFNVLFHSFANAAEHTPRLLLVQKNKF